MNLRAWLARLPAPLESALRLPARGAKELYYLARDAAAQPHPSPVFVLGNQKSGTTAIAALLGLASGLPTTLDLRRETQRDFYLRLVRGEQPFERLLRRNGLDFSRPIVKEPNLTFFRSELVARFPDARFAFVLRDPRDNIRSILDRAAIPGDLDRVEARHLDPLDAGWRLVLDSRWLGIESGEHYVDRLAARWNACLAVYEAAADATVLVRYEDFLADKTGSVARLAEGLGLRAERDIRDRVDTQYQMRGNRGVAWQGFFGANLARIERICGEGLARFGYAPGPSSP